MANYSKELEFVTKVSREAAAVALLHYGKVERLTKTHVAANQEAVTEADRAVQAFIVKTLREQFPQDGIIGEEDDTGVGITNTTTDPKGRVWVIDPIDGTNNFIGGFGNFCVCIGLMVAGEPVVGAVHDVTRNQTYRAAKGLGMWLDDVKKVAPTSPFGDASILMVTSNLLDKQGKLPAFVPRWMGQTTWKVRCLGSAALEAALVAGGVAHGAITMNGKLWDVAAAAALVLEAGGRVVDLEGNDLFPFNLANYTGAKVPFLATGPAALDALVKEIRS